MIKVTKKPINATVAIMLSVFMACGCSQEETPSVAEAKPIRVNATIGDLGGQTRFTDYGIDATQSTSIYSGQYVWAWALYHESQATYMTAWRLTASSQGTLSGSAKYYPDDGSVIDIVAVQGHFSETLNEAAQTAFPTSGLTHSVMDNQASQANYASSDLLYARVDNKKGSDNAVVTLPFKHYLSKLEITLASPEGHYSKDDLKHATVEIMNVKKTVTISMNNGNAETEPTVTTTGTTGSILLKDGTLGDARGVVYETSTDSMEAVVPPQTIAEGLAFIKVTLTTRNNRVLNYQIPEGGLTLLKNQRYQYIFTLFESNITLSGATYQSGFDDNSITVSPEP